MMIKVIYPVYDDRGSHNGVETVGYFNSMEEARRELIGLCPWDFNSMWGGSHYNEFRFDNQPGILTKDDKEFIDNTQKALHRARNHAEKWKGSWHTRFPG